MSKFRVGVMLNVFLWDRVEGLEVLCINIDWACNQNDKGCSENKCKPRQNPVGK